jgi:hypothetical protein
LTKADNILFNTSKVVGKAVGGFSIGDDVMGMTIAEILAKLLGLSDKVVEPDVPEVPTSIVENIIANQLPMYQLSGDGQLAELPYNYIPIPADEAAGIQQKPTESGFYQIINADGSSVNESGYQQIQVRIPSVPFMIALPSIIDYPNQVTAQAYNEIDKTWSTTRIVLTNDPIEIATICDDEGCLVPEIPRDDYTLWVSKDAVLMSSNAIYRFIITDIKEA